MDLPVPYPGDLVEHLRAVAVLAGCLERDPRGTFEAAAFSLRVDVSVLRRRMQALAEWSGAALLEGRGARLRITPAGEAARILAGRVLEEVQRFQGRAGGPPPRLRLGCTGTVTTELLPTAIARLRARWPELPIQIRRAGAERARAMLEANEIDLAVVRGDSRTPPGVEGRRLARDTVWLAVPRGHRLARRRRLAAEDLAGEPIISFPPSSTTRRRVMSVLEPLGAVVQVEVEGKAAALRYVELGMGVALLSLIPGHRVRAPGVALRDVTRLFPPAVFWAVWRAGRPLGPAEDQLLRELRRLGSRRSP